MATVPREAVSSHGRPGWLFPRTGGTASNKICSNNVCFDGRGSRDSGPGGNYPAPSRGSVQHSMEGSLDLEVLKEVSPEMQKVGDTVIPKEPPQNQPGRVGGCWSQTPASELLPLWVRVTQGSTPLSLLVLGLAPEGHLLIC